MKKAILSVVAAVAASAFAENSTMGWLVLNEADGINSSIVIGQLAGNMATNWADNVAIGVSAGTGVQYANNCIALGVGALGNSRNIHDCVAIGRDELSHANYWSDTTSINGKQFFASKFLDAWCINPDKATSIQNAELWAMDGTIHFNAGKVDFTNQEIVGLDIGASNYELFYKPTGASVARNNNPTKLPSSYIVGNRYAWDYCYILLNTTNGVFTSGGLVYLSVGSREVSQAITSYGGYLEYNPLELRYPTPEGANKMLTTNKVSYTVTYNTPSNATVTMHAELWDVKNVSQGSSTVWTNVCYSITDWTNTIKAAETELAIAGLQLDEEDNSESSPASTKYVADKIAASAHGYPSLSQIINVHSTDRHGSEPIITLNNTLYYDPTQDGDPTRLVCADAVATFHKDYTNHVGNYTRKVAALDAEDIALQTQITTNRTVCDFVATNLAPRVALAEQQQNKLSKITDAQEYQTLKKVALSNQIVTSQVGLTSDATNMLVTASAVAQGPVSEITDFEQYVAEHHPWIFAQWIASEEYSSSFSPSTGKFTITTPSGVTWEVQMTRQ